MTRKTTPGHIRISDEMYERLHPSPVESSCSCVGRSNEYRYQADPDWWSCMDCDLRVRPLTEAEKVTLT